MLILVIALVEDLKCLKILMINNSYKCPIQGCDKNFRRENLAQMHVKHYHPEYTKFLDSTPNVADLAYARTVSDSLDRSVGPEKPKHVQPKVLQPKAASLPKTTTLKLLPPAAIESENHLNKVKDSEIIKLLNNKSGEGTDDQKIRTPILPSGLPPNMYPDIKLKDLLGKCEAIPRREDLNLKTLSASTQRPTGIKTLLPVIRKEPKAESNDPDKNIRVPTYIKTHPSKQNLKRKSVLPEPESNSVHMKVETPPNYIKFVEPVVQPQPQPQFLPQSQPPPQPQPSNVIIEGGEVIKIVRMKSEEIINCTCGITEEDGLMIQCELCLCWQHAYCNNITKESEVPEKYICYICQNPFKQRSSMKYSHDQDWLKQGILPVGSYHCKDDEVLKDRFEILKKSFNLTGSLLELKDFAQTLRVKKKIAR